MSNVSRRKFIKSIGLCTILAATGNTHDALSFFPSQLNIQGKRQSPLSEPNGFTLPENIIKILFITVGNKGFKIAKVLQSGPKPIDVLAGKPAIIQHFSPNNNQIDGFISEGQIVFLIGSMKDRDFWIARELINCHDLFLSFTIAIEDENPLLAAQNFPVNEQEACVFIHEKHYEHQAILTIHSLFSMLMIPSRVGLDFADVKSNVSGKSGVMVHTVSSYKDSFNAFKQTIDTYKAHIKNSSGLLLNIIYNDNIDFTLRDLSNISGEVHNCCHSDADIVWGLTECLKLDADFRATLFISMNDNNLIDDMSLAKRETDNLKTLHPT
ncbi:hypothetical protein [Desulfobacula sp.]|uniref:hypothetical protein n=1 Tax=Desulfobacula sp. TaxID=2593537 RepID=UPI00262C744E|nr:hypothetical protein [Desulfobacula sp.]